jgi:hypothetical protein
MKTTYNFLNKLSLQILTLTLFSSTIAYGFATQTPGKAEPVWNESEHSSNDSVIGHIVCILTGPLCTLSKGASPENKLKSAQTAILLANAKQLNDPDVDLAYFNFNRSIQALSGLPATADIDKQLQEIDETALKDLKYDSKNQSITTALGTYLISPNSAATSFTDTLILDKVK